MGELATDLPDVRVSRIHLPAGHFARFGKRSFDLVIAGAAIIVLAPVFLLIAVLIKLDSRGPVFFRQARVGRNRRLFFMWKFRKMHHDLPQQGPSLTRRYDARLTRLGQLLERTKLDELPQLFNVLVGEMSIVGPRPELPKFVEHHSKQWDRVLSVKPGLFGPCQIRFRNESELYPSGCADVESYYIRHILPAKLAIDAAYAAQFSLLGDAVTLFRAVFASLGGIVTRQTLVNRRWQILNTLLLSAAGFVGTLAIVRLLARDLSSDVTLWILLVSLLTKAASIAIFKIPKALATSVAADDLLRCCWCAAVSGSILGCAEVLAGLRDLSRLLLLADSVFFLTVLILYKLICYNFYTCFFRAKSWGLWQHLVLASLLVSPLSMVLILVARHGSKVWEDGRSLGLPGLILLTLMIRPAVLLFKPIPSRVGQSPQPLYEWWKLFLGSLVGSSLLVSGAMLINVRNFSRLNMVCDGALYLAAMTAVAYWSQRRNQQAVSADGELTPGPNERLLLIGEGAELGNYVSALKALPENRFELVGALSTHYGYRTNMAGGVSVLGELTDAPDVVRLMGVTRVVVLDTDISDADLNELRSACDLKQEQVVKVEILTPLMRL